MKENKVRKIVEELRNKAKVFKDSGCAVDGIVQAFENSANTIEELFEEIQQYKAIGTVEDFKRTKAMENVCGQVKWERDVAISQLEEIGVSLGQKMDQFKALKDKNKPKKIVKYKNGYVCPICNHWVGFRYGYCDGCGNKLDWSE